jgi:hypothetical protein
LIQQRHYYRELQNLRDPLHFQESAILKRRDAHNTEKHQQLDSRKNAIRRWKNKLPEE